jgi:cytoskeletal protein CcmA (bactofilin family)
MATDIPVLEEIIEGKITTVVADDLEIKGTIKFKSSVMLKGIFEGEIQSEGLLVVGPTAKVTATITTKTLVSHGEITGNVIADKQILLKGTATHAGDLKAPFITIDNGAVFNGAAVMERKQGTERSVETYEEEPKADHETTTNRPTATREIEENGDLLL